MRKLLLLLPLLGGCAGSDDLPLDGRADFPESMFVGESRSFGGTGLDWAWDVAAPARHDRVVVSGQLSEGNDLGLDPGPFLGAFDRDDAVVWAKPIGASAVRSCEMGSVIAVGSFMPDLQVDGHTLTSAGETDVYLARIDARDGTLLWVRRFGGPGTDLAVGLAVDAECNAVLLGRSDGGGDLEGAEGSGGSFLARFDGEGTPGWIRRFGNEGDFPADVAMDADGNTFVTGQSHPAQGALNALYLARFLADGSEDWRIEEGEGGGNAVATTEDGGVWVTGWMSGKPDLGGGPLDSGMGAGILLARFGADGSHQASRLFGNGAGEDLAVGFEGSVFVTGGFYNGLLPGLKSAGGEDLFVVHFDADLEPLSAKIFGDDGDDQRGLAFSDPAQNEDLWLVGGFTGTLAMDPSPLTANGRADGLLARISVATPVP